MGQGGLKVRFARAIAVAYLLLRVLTCFAIRFVAGRGGGVLLDAFCGLGREEIVAGLRVTVD